MRKKHIFILAALAALLTAVFLFFLFRSDREDLEVSFLSVGQGDSILIEDPNGQNILIDGGPDNSVIYELGQTLPFYDRTIDLMVLTHPHADHVTGLVEVLDRYEVKMVLMTGVDHDSPIYGEWRSAAEGVETRIADGPQRIILGDDSRLEILWPRENLEGRKVDNLNNTSIVARLVYGDNEFLFTGDIEKEAEDSLLGTGAELEADVLKVAHHGSDTSSSDDLLREVSPEAAVISFGDNSFGFPGREAMDRLERAGVAIFDTSEERVVIESDGRLLSAAGG